MSPNFWWITFWGALTNTLAVAPVSTLAASIFGLLAVLSLFMQFLGRE